MYLSRAIRLQLGQIKFIQAKSRLIQGDVF
jgi:hypothetical protein